MAEVDAAGAAGSSALLDLPEPLLLLILGFLHDPRSRNRAALSCTRLLAAERATRAAMSLRGDPRTPEFLLLPPGFCFPALQRLDLSLISPWGHPLLSSASPAAGYNDTHHHHHPDEIAERNAFVAGRLAAYFPAVASLAVYCRDPSTLENLAPCWRGTLRSVKLVRWHQRPPGLPGGADLEPLLRNCPALRALDLSEFYCWTEDIVPALAAHPLAAAALTDLDLGLAGATNGFPASELGAIAASCPNLHKLVAPCVFNPRYVDSVVGDDALRSLASSCPRLTVLRLSEPFEPASTSQREQAGITVVGLVAFFAALPELEDLTLDLQHDVLEAAPAMEALARGCPRIKFLTLGCFQGLCKASWLHLDGVAVCGGLVSLCIKNCQDLTDNSLAAIGRGCERLAKFAIQGCDLVTSAGIRRLATALRPMLKEVSILQCRFLHTAECLAALSPIRDQIESLEINCDWEEVEQPGCVANGTAECNHEDDEPDETSYESASKKCRYMMELDNFSSWEMLRSLSLWLAAGQQLSPLISAGLDSCPLLEKISIKVEGDLRTCPRPSPLSVFGLSDLGAFPVLAKMKLDLSEAVGYALTAPTGHIDLTQWDRFYLSGIESLESLYELDYWPPQDKDVNQRSLSLPAVGLFQRSVGLRKIFVHGTTHEHFMSFFLKMPNLRDIQLREDYYPAPENDMMITEMRPESWLRFEMQLNNQPRFTKSEWH
uniref:Uncharacterized protein n=1 Tax=Avena sativa TaxID=4498 RepID=A0ACD6AAI6_AVESA